MSNLQKSKKNERIRNSDLDEIIINSIRNRGLYPHIVESFNTLCTSGISEILTNLFRIEQVVPISRTESELDRQISSVKFEVKFLKVNMSKPMEEGIPVFPVYARKKDKSYMSTIHADITISATAYLHNGETKVKEQTLKNYEIAEMPIMVGSILCHTYGMTREALERIGENPSDPKLIFIINGSEWTINNLISRKYNLWYIYKNNYNRELARAEFISIPGDSFENSSEIIIRYYDRGEITIQLVSDRYFKVVEIPFYVILKLFGMPTEKIIVNNIAPMTESNEILIKMREILATACTTHYSCVNTDYRVLNDQSDIITALIEDIATKYTDSKGIVSLDERQKSILIEKKILKENIMFNFDKNVLPHQGVTSANRFNKALYICIGVRKMIDCYFGIIPQTDRDSSEYKRIHPVGDSIARMFKKETNKEIISQLRKTLNEMAANNSFYDYDLEAALKIAFKSAVLKNRIIANFNQGMAEKVVNNETIKNRTPSENIKRKNHLNLLNGGTIMRTTHSSQSKHNERAFEMRAVKPQFPGTTCVIQSGEGINAGMIQNTTLSTRLSTNSSTEIMITILFEHEAIIPYNKIFGINTTYTKVYVNGRWIGYVKKPILLYQYFRERRRGWDAINCKRIENDIIDRYMTMCWNNVQKEIDFRTDRGRPSSPYIIVYNNLNPIGQHILGSRGDPYTGEGFEQRTLITMEHIKGLQTNKITTDDLFREGIIDYIAPEELKQIICAESIELINERRYDFYHLYTHLTIPSSLISITSALTPFPHECPPGRIILAGNHIRQSCDSSYRYDTRYDKQAYYQSQTQFPIVYTITNLFAGSSGINAYIAVGSFDGANIEDSLVQNKSFVERGAYHVLKYTYFTRALEANESFGKPDYTNTEHINKEANYSKLNQEGYIPPGTYVQAGDVIIGCLFNYQEAKVGNYNYRDISEIYNLNEPGYVVDVDIDNNSSFNKFIKLRIEISRPMGTGEKMASRNGQKGMAALSVPQSDMPFTSAGIIPAYIISPNAFPSRGTTNQLKESICGKVASWYGKTCNGSLMVETSMDTVCQEMLKLGWSFNGTDVMYFGRTGKVYNMNIFIGPVYQCRLQKFSAESAYAVGNNGPISYTTRQPIGGQTRGGGLKLGEMEKDNLAGAQGAIRFFTDKSYHDSDGIDIYICRTCGYEAIGNDEHKIYICNICGPQGVIIKFPTRFNPHLIKMLFSGMGAKLRYIMRPTELLEK